MRRQENGFADWAHGYMYVVRGLWVLANFLAGGGVQDDGRCVEWECWGHENDD